MLWTKNDRLLILDVEDFYLNSKLKEHKCIIIDLCLILEDCIAVRNLDKVVHNGKVLVKVHGSMYGLKQIGKLIHEDLKNPLEPY